MEEQKVIKDLDEVLVPDELGPVSYTVTQDDVEEFLKRVGDPNPWYREDSPFGGPIVPPTYTAGDYTKLLGTKYSAYDVVHTHAAHEYMTPVRVGDILTAKGVLVEKYIRRGREYIVVDSATTNQNGEVVVKSRNTWLVNASKRRSDSPA